MFRSTRLIFHQIPRGASFLLDGTHYYLPKPPFICIVYHWKTRRNPDVIVYQ